MTHIIDSTRRTFLAFCVGVLVLISGPHHALAEGFTLNRQLVDIGSAKIPVTTFSDDTLARSPIQANALYNRIKNSNQATPSSIIHLHDTGGDHWIALNITNNTRANEWVLTLEPQKSNAMNPIKALALYDIDSPDLRPLAIWPQSDNIHPTPRVTLDIEPGETVLRYVLIESWDGIDVPLKATIQTLPHVEKHILEKTRQVNILWLIMGLTFGAGLVQLILTRQGVQGMLALNALVVGGSVFLQYRYDIVSSLLQTHALVFPLMTASLIGIAASLMLWAASRRIGIHSLVVLVPAIINAVFLIGAVVNIDIFFAQIIPAEMIPYYIIMLTGLSLIVITMTFTFSNVYMAWFLPAWLALTIMPWLNAYFPVGSIVLYLSSLTVAGVASVFSYWDSMDRETSSLQIRLRSELKNIKSKLQEENNSWQKKMDSQRDILNELRQREQQRSADLEVARKEAETANKAKSDFLAIISHEIRTPMNGIMGIVQIIEQTSLDNKQREYIDVIKNSGDTMVTLLNDILDYSKIEKGMIEIENIPFSLRKMINSVAMLMSGRAKDKGIAIHVDFAPELKDMYMGDAGRIRQILLNLVSNAVKFTDNGSVTIRAIPAENSQILFEIIDTGIGIASEAQEKLFKAYTQADASISRRYGGTGLGLNICRMLVEAMQGTIGMHSDPGKGSKFWFSLPLAATNKNFIETRNDLENSYKPSKKIRALVVDDNAINLKIITSFLEMDGHEFVTAMDGQKAMDLLNNDRFDVVFLDMLMPVMDGKTFVTTLRKHSNAKKANMPIFALTGLTDAESIEQINQIGVSGILSKPVNQKDIRRAIDALTGKQNNAATPEMHVLDIIRHLDDLSDDDKQILRTALSTGTQENAVKHDTIEYLNMTILNELKGGLPQETLNDIFNELVDKAKELSGEIQQAYDAGDMKQLNEKAHNLKGMAGNFGLQALMNIYGALEQAIKENDPKKTATLIQDSRHILDQSLIALDQWLKS